MAPKRAPRAELIFDGPADRTSVTGVLVSRAEGTDAREMAMRALEVDAGWSHDDAVQSILAARIEPGRWWKTPDRHGPGWILHRAGMNPRRGATPGVLFSLG